MGLLQSNNGSSHWEVNPKKSEPWPPRKLRNGKQKEQFNSVFPRQPYLKLQHSKPIWVRVKIGCPLFCWDLLGPMFNPGFAPLSPQCWWAHKRGTDWHVVGVSQPAAALPVPSFGSDGSTFQGVETATGGDWWMFCRHSWGGKIIWIWICVQYIYILIYGI